MKRITTWSLVLIWMIGIFIFSNMDSKESNDKSKKVIQKSVDATVDIAQKSGIIQNAPTNIEKKQIVNQLNLPVRKIMHILEYCILAILTLCALLVGNNRLKLSILICLLLCIGYASFDEYHQTHVGGRTGKYQDIFIDSVGAIIGIGIYSIYYPKKKESK